jgi:hypothetical protein
MKPYTEQYPDTLFHWNPQSERYATVDVLLEHLRIGWQLADYAEMVRYYFGGQRHIDLYHFTLYRGQSQTTIPVLSNPVMLSIVKQQRLFTTQVDFVVERVAELTRPYATDQSERSGHRNTSVRHW